MGEWHEKFQCFVEELRYDYGRHAGRLVMSDLNCTGMRGCISVFEAIDPDVQVIDTVQRTLGGHRNTTYSKIGGEWHSDGGKHD